MGLYEEENPWWIRLLTSSWVLWVATTLLTATVLAISTPFLQPGILSVPGREHENRVVLLPGVFSVPRCDQVRQSGVLSVSGHDLKSRVKLQPGVLSVSVRDSDSQVILQPGVVSVPGQVNDRLVVLQHGILSNDRPVVFESGFPSVHARDHLSQAEPDVAGVASTEERWSSLAESGSRTAPLSLDHIDSLMARRLWHEASLELLRLVGDPAKLTGEQQARWLLSQHVLTLLKNKANPMIMVEIMCLLLSRLQSQEEALRLLGMFRELVQRHEVATALCDLQKATMLLEHGALHEATELLQDVEERLKETAEVVPVAVLERLYWLLASCCQKQENLPAYYDAALRYLSCSDWGKLPGDEQRNMAATLIVCALLSDDINHMAELQFVPLVWSLRQSENDCWLLELLEAVDCGEMAQVRAAEERIAQDRWLSGNLDELIKKAATRALQEACQSAVKRGCRMVPLSALSMVTQLSDEETEELVLTALARGNLEGQLNEDGLLQVDRVLPRPLTPRQMQHVSDGFDAWMTKIAEEEERFEVKVDELQALYRLSRRH